MIVEQSGQATGAIAARITRKNGTVEFLVPYAAMRKYGGLEGACARLGYDPAATRIDFTGCCLVTCPHCGLAFMDADDRDEYECPACNRSQ